MEVIEGGVMAGSQRADPLTNFRFLVEIDGIQQAAFMECTGLGSHIEVVDYREAQNQERCGKSQVR
jgi:phage tail-like protein